MLYVMYLKHLRKLPHPNYNILPREFCFLSFANQRSLPKGPYFFLQIELFSKSCIHPRKLIVVDAHEKQRAILVLLLVLPTSRILHDRLDSCLCSFEDGNEIRNEFLVRKHLVTVAK